MDIGDLRERITLQSETVVADGGGGYAPLWTDSATLWAAVIPLDGKETVDAAALGGHTNYRIIIRFGPNVTPAMRIIYGARILNIRSVKNMDERDQWIEIMAEEGAAT